MSTSEIISSIKNLPLKDRLKIIEMVIHSLQDSEEQKLENAALLMFDDYKNDHELTSFTSLDMENFYETRGNLAS